MKLSTSWLIVSMLVFQPVRAVEQLQYEIVASYPHDPKAWTQGLFYNNGTLYESTGLYGQSSLRRVDLKTGRVLQNEALSDRYFAEGITLFKDKLYQLTWLANTGFIYNPKSFERIGSFKYFGEGWGLTHDSSHLILSDGTSVIRFIDPETMMTVRRINVRMDEEAMIDLNELEYIEGYIYANVWHENMILKIDPANGQVVGLLDLSELWPERPKDEGAVLNGIAYNAEKDVFYITGKFWAKLFEIRLKESTK